MVAEAGVDTVRWLLYIADLREDQTAREEYGNRGRGRLGFQSVGYSAGVGLLNVEGRPVQALRNRETHELLPANAMREAQDAVLQHVRGEYPSAVPVGISRVDVTATFYTQSAPEGWALIRGMGGLAVPRRKTSVFLDAWGHPQTSNWITDRGVVKERIYDKGAQRGAPPGRLIRLEAQTRHQSRERMTAEWWTREHVTKTFEKRFSPMARASEGVLVGSESVVRNQVRMFVEDGRITGRMAELLLGHIAAEQADIRGRAASTRRRRRAELRRLGLSQALDGIDQGDELRVDLAGVLEEAITSGAWSDA